MASALESTLDERPSVDHKSLRIRRLHSIAEVDELEPSLRNLGDCQGNPLAQFTWWQSCLAAFPAEGSVQFAVVQAGDDVLALAPLVRRRLLGLPRLYLAGVAQLFEPADLVWADPDAARELIAHLVRGGLPFHLERIAADSPTLRILKDACRGRARLFARPQATCPYIMLDKSWLEPESKLNSGRRSDLRRARRKAEQLGQVTSEILVPELDELPPLLDLAFEVESKSWKGAAGTALVHDPARTAFYRHYAQAACADGLLRVCFLRIGERVVAMQLAVEHGGGFWLLKVGYDEQFSPCSPGLLLMRDTIHYAAEAGLDSYEFLGRAEAWTQVWTKTERDYISLRVYPLGVRGLAALAADGAATLARRWRVERCD